MNLAAGQPYRLLEHLPGVGVINLAQLLAEIGPVLDRVDPLNKQPWNAGLHRSPRPRAKPLASTFDLQPTKEPARQSPPSHTTRECRSRWAATLYADARARGKPENPRRSASSPELDPHHLGMLAFRRPVRPNRPPSPATDRGMNNLTQGTQMPDARESGLVVGFAGAWRGVALGWGPALVMARVSSSLSRTWIWRCRAAGLRAR